MNTTILLVFAFVAIFLALQSRTRETVVKKEKRKKFPNGFESWYETYFLVCEFIVQERAKESMTGKIKEMQVSDGTAGMFQLSKDWTTEFELLHKGEDWSELDFYDEVEKFCELKNKEICV